MHDQWYQDVFGAPTSIHLAYMATKVWNVSPGQDCDSCIDCIKNKYVKQIAELLNDSENQSSTNDLTSKMSKIARQRAQEEVGNLICHPKEPECWRIENRQECAQTAGCSYEVCPDGVSDEERAFNKKIQDIERDIRMDDELRSTCQEWEGQWSLIEGGKFSQFCEEIG